jgi:hypothetical protein
MDHNQLTLSDKNPADTIRICIQEVRGLNPARAQANLRILVIYVSLSFTEHYRRVVSFVTEVNSVVIYQW